MSLSKDERRRLDELAEQLSQEDPALCAALTGPPDWWKRVRRTLRRHESGQQAVQRPAT